MDRREFLRLLGLGAAGAAVGAMELDVDRLLWTPGEKTLILPPAGGWPQAQPFNPDILRESIRQQRPDVLCKTLKEQAVEMLHLIQEARESKRDAHGRLITPSKFHSVADYRQDGYRIGDAEAVSKPASLPVLSVRMPIEAGLMSFGTKDVVFDHQIHVLMEHTEDRQGRWISSSAYLRPAAYALAKRLDDLGINVCGVLPNPRGFAESAVVHDGGIALRAVQDWDWHRNAYVTRFDILGGRA